MYIEIIAKDSAGMIENFKNSDKYGGYLRHCSGLSMRIVLDVVFKFNVSIMYVYIIIYIIVYYRFLRINILVP